MTAHEQITKDIQENPVVLYMKGTPVFPQCGFSATVVQILSNLGVKYKAIDVLKVPAAEATFSAKCTKRMNWPPSSQKKASCSKTPNVPRNASARPAQSAAAPKLLSLMRSLSANLNRATLSQVTNG